MMKKVSILTLSLVMFINGVVVAGPSGRRRARKGVNTPVTTPAPTNNTQTSNNTIATPSVANITPVAVTEDPRITTGKKEIVELRQSLITSLSELAKSVNDAKSVCGNISDKLSTIFGLNIATTVSSGAGTLSAGGALGVGIAKAVKDGKIAEKEKELERLSHLADALNENSSIDDIKKVYDLLQGQVMEQTNQLKEEIAKDTKQSKILGHVRTGLMAGATVTSGVSTATSIASSITAHEVAEDMAACSRKLADVASYKSAVELAKEDLESKWNEFKPFLDNKAEYETYKNAEIQENDNYKDNASKDIRQAEAIVKDCRYFNVNDISAIKAMSTANAVVSGVGTLTGIAGTTTSILANTNKVRDDNSQKGKKTEQGLNIASNILAGITTGTSGASTVIGGISIAKVKELVDKAKKCEKLFD